MDLPSPRGVPAIRVHLLWEHAGASFRGAPGRRRWGMPWAPGRSRPWPAVALRGI